MRALRIAPAVLLTLLLAGTAQATATPRVTLRTSFEPDISGASTTLHYAVSISQATPVQTIDLRLPKGLQLATSSLGLAECEPQLLQENGPPACPANSVMGRGTATGEVVLDSDPPKTFALPAAVLFALGPSEHKPSPKILIMVESSTPFDMIMLTSRLIPQPPPYSYSLQIEAPLLPAWFEGPDIALTRLAATIGPKGVTYYRHEDGITLAYKPRGFSVPSRCPPNGYPFQAIFHFYNGATASTNDRAPCPTHRQHQ